MITDRDVEILKYINLFGKVFTNHISQYFNISDDYARKILRRLKEDDLVETKRIFMNKPFIVYLTKKGAKFTEYGAIKNLQIYNIEHSMKIVDCYNKLKSEIKYAKLYTDRVSRRTLQYEFNMEHRPDLIYRMESESFLCVEVELNRKTKARMEDIIMGYNANLSIEKVIYFTYDEHKNYLSSFFEGNPLFELRTIEKFV